MKTKSPKVLLFLAPNFLYLFANLPLTRYFAHMFSAAAKESTDIRDQALQRVDELDAELKKIKISLEKAKQTSVAETESSKTKADAIAARDEDLRIRVKALTYSLTGKSCILFCTTCWMLS